MVRKHQGVSQALTRLRGDVILRVTHTPKHTPWATTLCSPPASLPQHLRLLPPLQLAHVAQDAAVAHQQALGGLQSLLSLGAGCQQLAGPFPHPDLMV